MNGGIDQLATVIAAHLRDWAPSPQFVELAIYESADAYSIAGILNSFCVQNLGFSVAAGLFHQSSIGSVTGIVLGDGRSIVIKAHQPDRSREFLTELVRVQWYLAERGAFGSADGDHLLSEGHGLRENLADQAVVAVRSGEANRTPA
jgi:hypothetical protein